MMIPAFAETINLLQGLIIIVCKRDLSNAGGFGGKVKILKIEKSSEEQLEISTALNKQAYRIFSLKE